MFRAFIRSFWQAYREQRVVLLVSTLMVFVPVALGQFVLDSRAQVLFAALVIPLFFVLVSCVMTIAAERESGTLDDLQLMKPPRYSYLFGKILWALMGLALLEGLSFQLAMNSIGDRVFSNEVNDPLLVILFALSLIEAVGWGLWMSAHCRTVIRALTAAIVAVISLSGLFSLVFPVMELLAEASRYGAGLSALDNSIAIAIVVRLFLALFVLALGWRSVFGKLQVPASRWVARPMRRQLRASRTLLITRRLGVIAWQEVRVQRWTWMLMLFPFALGCLFAFVDTPGLRPRYGLAAFVLPLMFGSAMLGMFTTRYDLDRERYQFFEQLGVPLRSVWKFRFLLSLPQWFLLVVGWLAMCGLAGLPVVDDTWNPSEYGSDYTAVTKSVLVMTTLVAGLLTLLVSQFISLHVHRPIVAWLTALLSAGVLSGLSVLWLCALGKAVLWISIAVVALGLVLWTFARVNRLISSRTKVWDRAVCCGFAAVAPVGLCAVQYAHWLSTGPPMIDTRFLPEPLTSIEVRERFDQGEPIPGTGFGGKEGRLWYVATFDPQFWERYLGGQENLADVTVGDVALTRFVELVLATQETDPDYPEYLEWDVIHRSVDNAESVIRNAYIRNQRMVDLDDFAERVFDDPKYLKNSSERLQFCKGIIEVGRLREKYSIGESKIPSAIGYRLLWEWCLEDDRTPEEISDVLRYLQDQGYHWTGEDYKVAAYCSVRQKFGNAGLREDFLSYDDTAILPWISRVPGYRERASRWTHWMLWNAVNYRQYQFESVVNSRVPDKNASDQVDPWFILSGMEPTYRYTRWAWLQEERSPEEIAKYATGFLSIGARFPEPLASQDEVHAFAEHVLEYRATVMRIATRLYQVRNNGALPGELSELVDRGILKTLPIDPYTGHPFVYRSTDSWSVNLASGTEASSEIAGQSPLDASARILWSPGPWLIGRSQSDFRMSQHSATLRFAKRGSGFSPEVAYSYLASRSEDELLFSEDSAFALGTSWSLLAPARYPTLRSPIRAVDE